ncbi:MAG: hypothetical protein FWD17_10310, partial [Polyangiaceae bacterium]|nr:hypothetical protein [Polyangiaceae bacterium]
APEAPRIELAGVFAAALHLEATGSAEDAARAYLALVHTAAASADDPFQVPALEASLDALVAREMPVLGEGAADVALAERTRLGAAIASELARALAEARGPFAAGLLARASTEMAERAGDAAAAERARFVSGCVREARVVGPTRWTPITGVRQSGPLDGADAKLEASYPTGDAFGAEAHPILVQGHGCDLPLSAERARPGVRDVVVDVTVPREQTIGLVLRAHGAAALRAGGTPVVERPFELGDGEAARFARVTASAGTLRLVARVGTAKEDDSVEIDAFGDDGAPLQATAPEIGSVATAHVTPAPPARPPAIANDDEALLSAAASLAAGDPREAERVLWPGAPRPGVRADIALVYGRAIDQARDLSAATRAERARTAYEHVLETWPSSWEATIAHAVLAGVRHGKSDAGIEALRDLDELRAKPGASTAPILDAFEALTAGREHLFDRAQAALSRARQPLAGTALLVDAEDAASPRVGAERAAAACDPARPVAHDRLTCFDALRALGDRAGAVRELARVRALLGSPAALLGVEVRDALSVDDRETAERAYSAMLPAERTLSALALLKGDDPAARDSLLALAATARDAPGALAVLLRGAGSHPMAAFKGVAESLAAEDRSHPILPNAGTAVLIHTERYEVSPQGLTHWLLFDVRRVSGTTDVEENAQTAMPDIWARATTRALRRRILKRDGRIVEPDRTPHASQAHADLSQLEQGDVVEAIYEGWALPSDTGDIGIDTPDLLPVRTAVHQASIELRIPRALRASLWSHALLGPAAERVDGDSRILTWHLSDHPGRRLEDGVPKMDRNVGISLSTAEWSRVAGSVGETLAALDEHEPEVDAWAHEAAPDAGKSPRAAVDAVVAAAGRSLHEGDAGTLSDYGGGIAAAQTQTARTFLASHDGSRAWLILRALRSLGIGAELVVAENEPFSADPSFPAHYGRFVHPLVLAHVPASGDAGGAGSPGTSGPLEDVWIDPDVAGPPLPAGRISPELRGRLALRTDGTIVPIVARVAQAGAAAHETGAGADGERDEVDLHLSLDSRGDARGTFAIVLRGRGAQELAEALLRIVGAERQRALREVVLGWLPWANVDDVQLASSDGSWQVSLRANVSVSGYAQAEGKTWLLPGLDPLHWVWPRARVSNLASTFAMRAARESALAVSSAVQYHVHRRVELPPGVTVKRAPGPVEVKSKLVEASRTLSVGTSALDEDFVLGVTTGTVSAAEYAAFVGAAHQADDGFLASTRVAVP